MPRGGSRSRPDEVLICGKPVRRGEPITEYELEILTRLAMGCFAKEIAWEIGLSQRTVEHYSQRLSVKLGARNNMHAVAIAISRGVIPALLG